MTGSGDRTQARRGRGAASRGDCGIALIVTLWAALALGLLAALAMERATADLRATRHLADRARATLAADGAVRLEIARLLTPGALWPPEAVWREAALGELTVFVRVRDEEGRVDLNAAAPELLESLALVLGAEAAEARRLADAVADYRDADALPRAQGAEAPDYAAAGAPPPRDSDFAAPEELARVLGVDPTLALRMRPHVTTYTAAPRPSAAAATETVRAATELAQATAGASLMTERDDAVRAVYAAIQGAVAAESRGRIARLEARTLLPGGARFEREAVVALDPEDAAWRVLRWRALWADEAGPQGTDSPLAVGEPAGDAVSQ